MCHSERSEESRPASGGSRKKKFRARFLAALGMTRLSEVSGGRGYAKNTTRDIRNAVHREWGLPSPLGRGWTATALSPALAGRMRGWLRGEDGSDRPGPSCSMETSNASSFWRAKRRIWPCAFSRRYAERDPSLRMTTVERFSAGCKAPPFRGS